MKILIVHAHPDPESFNAAVLERIQAGIDRERHELHVLDLYREGFDPVLRFDRQHPRRDLKDSQEMRPYRERIEWADHLIFVYPVWWYGLPAILKGFFDRVFVSGFAFVSGHGLPKGLLSGKSAWIVATIDSPSWFVRVFRRNAENHVVRSAILGFCGIRKVRSFLFTGTRSSSLRRRQAWLARMEEAARNL